MKKICLFLLVSLFIKNTFSKDSGGLISLQQFTAARSIKEFISDTTILKFTIISYNVFYQPFGAEPEIALNNGAEYNENVKKLINKAKPNDIYYFEDIKVLGPDNITRKIAPFAFKIR
ncbi:MAG: GldM family protein [Chitinophagales bacterium]